MPSVENCRADLGAVPGAKRALRNDSSTSAHESRAQTTKHASRQLRSVWRRATCLIVLAGASAPANAYLDPGAVYAVLQPILVAIAGISAAFAVYRERLFGWLGIKSKAPREPPGANTAAGDEATTSSDAPTTPTLHAN